MLRSTALFGLFLWSTVAVADETVLVCHGYGCLGQSEIHYSEGQLGDVRRLLRAAVDPVDERKRLAEAVGLLYRWAGEQSDVRNDRAGNFNDGHLPGKMDCIDHSTSTTRLLEVLAGRGYLRWHRVLAPEGRYFLGLFVNHWSATIEETGGPQAGARFVVDSWFVNNGEAAVILPLDDWKKGAGPDV